MASPDFTFLIMPRVQRDTNELRLLLANAALGAGRNRDASQTGHHEHVG